MKERSESPDQCSIKLSTKCTTTATNKLARKTAPDALLWQYYLAHASKTIAASSSDPAHARMWEESVPAIAFSNAMVSHSLMAFSAFCLGAAPYSKGEARDLRATAEVHYYQAVKSLRGSLMTVDQSSADTVLACAMVLIPCGLALARNDERGFSLQDWLCHLRGWRTIGSSIYGDGDRLDSTSRLIPYPQPGIPESSDRLEDLELRTADFWTSSPIPLLDMIQCSWPDAVSDLKYAVRSSDTYIDPTNATAYSSAIAALEHVVDFILQSSVTNLFRAIFFWPIRISPDFIRLLECNDGPALAIYAHWLVITMAVEDFWWLEGFGSGQIEKLASRVTFTRSPSVELMRWPIEMLEGWRVLSTERCMVG